MSRTRAANPSTEGDRPRLQRCPACGQRLDGPPPAHCPLCGYAFGDERVTGADVTPYAQAYARGTRGARRMYEWIWFAGSGRLKHIALMRSSAASARFARTNIALLSLGLGVFAATQFGWAWVSAPLDLASARFTPPGGQGWVHVAEAPRPLPLVLSSNTAVDLWWNVPQCALAVVLGMAGGVVLAWLALVLIRGVVTLAHAKPYRHEQRLTAALHYGTAGVVPLAMAALATGLLPLGYIGRMARWRWYPPELGVKWAAATATCVGLCLWWFWLLRLGATAPPRTRWRVTGAMGVGAPLIAAGAAVAWYVGLEFAVDRLARALGLAFDGKIP